VPERLQTPTGNKRFAAELCTQLVAQAGRAYDGPVKRDLASGELDGMRMVFGQSGGYEYAVELKFIGSCELDVASRMRMSRNPSDKQRLRCKRVWGYGPLFRRTAKGRHHWQAAKKGRQWMIRNT